MLLPDCWLTAWGDRTANLCIPVLPHQCKACHRGICTAEQWDMYRLCGSGIDRPSCQARAVLWCGADPPDGLWLLQPDVPICGGSSDHLCCKRNIFNTPYYLSHEAMSDNPLCGDNTFGPDWRWVQQNNRVWWQPCCMAQMHVCLTVCVQLEAPASYHIARAPSRYQHHGTQQHWQAKRFYVLHTQSLRHRVCY